MTRQGDAHPSVAADQWKRELELTPQNVVAPADVRRPAMVIVLTAVKFAFTCVASATVPLVNVFGGSARAAIGAIGASATAIAPSVRGRAPRRYPEHSSHLAAQFAPGLKPGGKGDIARRPRCDQCSGRYWTPAAPSSAPSKSTPQKLVAGAAARPSRQPAPGSGSSPAADTAASPSRNRAEGARGPGSEKAGLTPGPSSPLPSGFWSPASGSRQTRPEGAGARQASGLLACTRARSPPEAGFVPRGP
jgi:hypothetical protein